tara:strand:+ start:150204 stop:150665 length:462 start_codon:yes stop_codon:yes gene_type:complete
MNDGAELERFLDEAETITAIDLSLDIARMRAEGDTMTDDEFSVERFDAAYESMLRKSNAERLTSRLSELWCKDTKLDGELVMTVTEDGIQFEGIEAWLPQVYAVKVPHRADEAREAAAAHLADDEKRPQIIESVKAMFWRSTARTFVEEAEAD